MELEIYDLVGWEWLESWRFDSCLQLVEAERSWQSVAGPSVRPLVPERKCDAWESLVVTQEYR